NLYGPTETTVAARARRTTAGDADEVIVPIGVAYPSRSVAVFDGDGKLLSGENKYVLHFEKGKLPPANAFWSITMYDMDGFQVP
ncbi:DUF1214 domain-containing protein, partial [Streptomyces niveiscabiei]